MSSNSANPLGNVPLGHSTPFIIFVNAAQRFPVQ